MRFRGDRVFEPRRDDLADELAAIANTHDGVLVLGVDDKTRDILGIPIERLEAVERYVYEICNESIKPPVIFRSFRMELPDGAGAPQPLLKVEVPRSLFVHKSPGGYFHRQGSSKREMTTDLLMRLGQQRSQPRLIRFEEQAVPQTTFADLDEKLRRRFLGSGVKDDVTSFKKVKLLTDDETGQTRATVAGILMCSSAPEKRLPGAFVQAVRYRGTRQDSNYQLDAQEITGPVDEQVRSAMGFVRKNMQVAARKSPVRVETPQFSMRAVFEAIVNAVAHRDYSTDGGIGDPLVNAQELFRELCGRTLTSIDEKHVACSNPDALRGRIGLDAPDDDTRHGLGREVLRKLLAGLERQAQPSWRETRPFE